MEGRHHLSRLADSAGVQDLAQTSRLPIEGKDKGLPEETTRLTGDRQDALGLLHRQAERLLTENRLAGTEGRDRPFGMQVVGKGDIDRIQAVILEQRSIPLNRLRNV